MKRNTLHLFCIFIELTIFIKGLFRQLYICCRRFTIFNAVTDLFGNMFNHGFNVSQYNWTRTTNAWKIDMGMFKGNFGQVVNKFTWGLFNSIVGGTVAHLYNTFGKIDGVTAMDGMLALSGGTGDSDGRAFTIGHYSIGPKGYKATWKDHIFVHEYGHYVQSQQWGPAYFGGIAIPSLMSAAFVEKWSGVNHHDRWFEADASYKGAKHFDKKYGSGADGYNIGNPNYFNKDIFIRGGRTLYCNPRTESYFQSSHPISPKKILFWDFVL